jgi:hypothetical protein
VRASLRWPVATLVVAVGGALLFAPSMGGDFVWDDRPLIVDDMRLRTLDGVMASVTGDFFDWASDAQGYGYWRPAVTLSYALQRAIFGPSAPAFHAFNVLAHALVMVLGLALGLRRGLHPTGLLVGTAAFSLMPSHVEAVTWISGRTDLLAAIGVLGALLADGDEELSWRRAMWVSALMLLAITSKELAIVTPVLALLVNQGRVTLVRSVSFGAPILLWLLVRATMVAVRPSDGPPETALEWVSTTPAAVDLYVRGLLGISAPLAYRTLPPVLDWARTEMWSGLTMMLAALAVGLRWPRTGRWLLAGSLCLLPALNLVRVAAPVDMGFPVSDRFAYLPSLFWALGIGHLVGELTDGRRRVQLVLASALVPLFVSMGWTLVRAQAVWADDATFFAATNTRNPGRPLIELQMVEALRRADQLEAAQREGELIARRHLEAGEDMPGELRLTLLAVASVGKSPTTVQQLWRNHIRAIPAPNAVDWLNLGLAEDRAGDFAAAEVAFVQAVQERPEFIPAWVGLGLARLKRGNLLGARAALDAGRMHDPDHLGLQQLDDLIARAETP